MAENSFLIRTKVLRLSPIIEVWQVTGCQRIGGLFWETGQQAALSRDNQNMMGGESGAPGPDCGGGGESGAHGHDWGGG